MSRTLINSAPYNLFLTDKARNEFTRRCGSCIHCNPDKWHMPQCPVFEVYVASILDRALRWEVEWVTLEKGMPVCLQYATGGSDAKVKT